MEWHTNPAYTTKKTNFKKGNLGHGITETKCYIQLYKMLAGKDF